MTGELAATWTTDVGAGALCGVVRICVGTVAGGDDDMISSAVSCRGSLMEKLAGNAVREASVCSSLNRAMPVCEEA